MTDFKALGKPAPIHSKDWKKLSPTAQLIAAGSGLEPMLIVFLRQEHYRQALLEAADIVEKLTHREELSALARQLRVSAGVDGK